MLLICTVGHAVCMSSNSTFTRCLLEGISPPFSTPQATKFGGELVISLSISVGVYVDSFHSHAWLSERRSCRCNNVLYIRKAPDEDDEMQ